MGLRLNWVIVFCLLSNIFLADISFATAEIQFKKEKITLIFKNNKKTLNLEVAETLDQHAQGLMFRKKLGTNEGMLFVFTNEEIREFWMKNTLINLDIGYFNKQKVLIDIQQMAAENSVMRTNIPTYPSKQPAMYALEMSQGWFKKNKFEAGTIFKFNSRP